MDSDISLVHQSGSAVVTVFLLDYLKKADWFFPKWINQNSEKLNRVISLVIAFGTAAGLKVLSGDAQHGWQIAVPPLQVLLDTLWHATTQFGGQEVLHKLLGNHQLAKGTADTVTALSGQVEALKNQIAGLILAAPKA